MFCNLAIIIPYFKIDFFEKTLSSLAQQTDQRFNVYIGDDASPIPPTELFEKYQGKFSFTYKRFKDNLGSISLAKQWERCIDMMQEEEWFMILGDDDVLGDNVIEEFYKNYEEFNGVSNVIRYSSIVVDGNSNVSYDKNIHPKFENSLNSFFRKINGETRSSLSEYVFFKKKYDVIKFQEFDLAWGADDIAVLEISDNKKIFSINKAEVIVRVSNESISGKKDNQFKKNKAILMMANYFMKKHSSQISTNQKNELIKFIDYKIFASDSFDIRSYLSLLCFSIEHLGSWRLNKNILKTIFYKIYLQKNQ